MKVGNQVSSVEWLDVHDDVCSLYPPTGSLVEVRFNVDVGECDLGDDDQQSAWDAGSEGGDLVRGNKRMSPADELWAPGGQKKKRTSKVSSSDRDAKMNVTKKKRDRKRRSESRKDGEHIVLDEGKRLGPVNAFGWHAPENVVWWIARVEGFTQFGMLLRYTRYEKKSEFISRVGEGVDVFDRSDPEYEVTVRFEHEGSSRFENGNGSFPTLYVRDVEKEEVPRKYRTASSDVSQAYESRPSVRLSDPSDLLPPDALRIGSAGDSEDVPALKREVDDLRAMLEGVQLTLKENDRTGYNSIPPVVRSSEMDRVRLYSFIRMGNVLKSGRSALPPEVQKKLRPSSFGAGDVQVLDYGHPVPICDFTYGEFLRLQEDLVALHSSRCGRSLFRMPAGVFRNFVSARTGLSTHFLLYTHFNDLIADIGLSSRDHVPLLFYESDKKSVVVVGNIGQQRQSDDREDEGESMSSHGAYENAILPAHDAACTTPRPGSRFVSVGVSLGNLARQVSSRTDCDWQVHCLELIPSRDIGPGSAEQLEFKGVAVAPSSIAGASNAPEMDNDKISQPMGLKWKPLNGDVLSNQVTVDQVPGLLYVVIPLVLIRSELLSQSAISYMQRVKLV